MVAGEAGVVTSHPGTGADPMEVEVEATSKEVIAIIMEVEVTSKEGEATSKEVEATNKEGEATSKEVEVTKVVEAVVEYRELAGEVVVGKEEAEEDTAGEREPENTKFIYIVFLKNKINVCCCKSTNS